MQHFECDYLEGAHPAILERLGRVNLRKHSGYGADEYCQSAERKIRAACNCPDARVFFLSGGTQANLVVIDALLRRFEGVLCADTGHINVHEAGAVEGAGHKVLALPQQNGKLSPRELQRFLDAFSADENHDHMVQPGMVYLSHPSESGTLYSREELSELSAICRAHHLPLFLDGARLGYGLAVAGAPSLAEIAALVDVFTIGGTKVGALFGEAVVFSAPALAPHFFTQMKQHGALLAKSWLIGLQFDVLFTDSLYLACGEHGVRMARKLRDALREKGFRFAWESETNQQFLLLEDADYQRLREKVAVSFWEKPDPSHTIVRIAASWATSEADVDALLASL